MAVMATLANMRTEQVMTVEGLIRLRPDHAEIEPDHPVIDALSEFRHGLLHINTGATYGPVRIHIEEWSARPEGLSSGWEVITERDLTNSSSADTALPNSSLWIGNINDSEPEIVVTDMTGRLRLRLHSRGRDAARARGDINEIVEEYLIQVWPSNHPNQPVHIFGRDAVTDDRLGAGHTSLVHNAEHWRDVPYLRPGIESHDGVRPKPLSQTIPRITPRDR